VKGFLKFEGLDIVIISSPRIKKKTFEEIKIDIEKTINKIKNV